MNSVPQSVSAEAEKTHFSDLLDQFQVVEKQLTELTQDIDQRLEREQELYSYIRLKTNTELTLAKEEIQAIFNSSDAGILVVDATFHLRACNRRGKELFFPATTDVVGKNCKDLICNRQHSQSECILDRVLQLGDMAEESDFAINDRFYHVVATPMNNGAGEIVYIILIYTDITQLKRQEKALNEADARLRDILNATPAAITLIDPQTHQIIFANQTFADMVGGQPPEIEGNVCHKFILPREKGQCPITDLGETIDKSECKLVRMDGRILPIIKTVTKIELNGQDLLLENFVDISVLKKEQQWRKECEERYHTLYSTMREGVAELRMIHSDDHTPTNYEFIDVNPAFEKIFSLPARHVVGRSASDIFPLVDDEPFGLNFFARAVREQVSSEFEYEFTELNKTIKVSVAPTSFGHFSAIFADVTQRNKDEARIAHMACFDTLTDLPNRLLLKDRLNQILTRAQRNNKQIALLFLDLDHFKRVNDTFGRDVGDQLLKIVANRLKNALHHCDSVCRLGGDEFGVLSDMISCQNDAERIAQKVHDTLKNPLVLKNKEIFINTSIGIAMYPADGDDADTLIKNADAAMYQSKGGGREEFRFYSSNANAQALQRLLMVNDLRKALDQQEFYLVYQPQIDMHSGQTIGVEALLRWHHPALGHLSPAQFIPQAEESGLILSIGRWILATACRQIMEIQDLSGVRLRVAVNLSAKQFRDVGLVAFIGELLADIGLDANLLELEISASTLMDNIDNATKTLYSLRELGLNLVMDDFGADYSSLSYLHHFPIQRLKVDKTVVRRLSTHPEDSVMTAAIIVMVHTLGIKVVAEGVENKQELDFLTAKKCDEVQGFYFSQPLTIVQLIEKINAGGSAQTF